MWNIPLILLFFFNDTATTEIYTLSLHDALPICSTARRPGSCRALSGPRPAMAIRWRPRDRSRSRADRKSTRLNSSHPSISYAVFCLKKKKKKKYTFSYKKKKKKNRTNKKRKKVI